MRPVIINDLVSKLHNTDSFILKLQSVIQHFMKPWALNFEMLYMQNQSSSLLTQKYIFLALIKVNDYKCFTKDEPYLKGHFGILKPGQSLILMLKLLPQKVLLFCHQQVWTVPIPGNRSPSLPRKRQHRLIIEGLKLPSFIINNDKISNLGCGG